jgi:hypothetical protein
VRNVNSDNEFALHCICASFDREDEVLDFLKVHGLGILRSRNKLGMTPMEYLVVNPYSKIDLLKIF